MDYLLGRATRPRLLRGPGRIIGALAEVGIGGWDVMQRAARNASPS